MRISGRSFSPKHSPPRLPSEASSLPHQEPYLGEAVVPKQSSNLGVGAAVLAGLSLLGVAYTNPGTSAFAEMRVEAPPEGEICLRQDLPTARVIVVDDYWKAEEHTTHGEIVESELARDFRVGEGGDITMERQVVSLWGGEHGIDEGRPGSLESYLREHFAGRMSRDADAMQRILEGGGPRGVIHQSQGASQSRAVDPIYYRALREDDSVRAVLRARNLRVEQPDNQASAEYPTRPATVITQCGVQ